MLSEGQKYCRLFQGELQYFRTSLSYQLSFRSLFCLCLSGLYTQVLLYADDFKKACGRYKDKYNIFDIQMVLMIFLGTEIYLSPILLLDKSVS